MFRRKQRNKKGKDSSSDIRKSADSLDKVLEGHASADSNAPFYRSRSASMDPCLLKSDCTSDMKGFPSDVRKSLVALDRVLQHFEDSHEKASRRHSAPILRNLFGKFGRKKGKDRDMAADVSKFMEVLDKVLNEHDDADIATMRKKRSSSTSNLMLRCNEDVRRSLEILDNVLAEFDDHDVFSSSDSILVNGDDKEIPLSHVHQEKERWEDENGNKLDASNLSSQHRSSNGHISPEFQSLDSSVDGSTSQNSSLLDESRRCSAPPVPKRSPGTRLSNRDRPFFPKGEEEDEPAQVRVSHLSLSNLHLTSQNGEFTRKAIAQGKRKAALSVPTPVTSSSSSPADDNAQISNRLRHPKITDEDPSLEFYLVRNGDEEDAADDDVFVSPPRRDVKCKTTTCQVCGGNLDHGLSSTSVRTAGPPGARRFTMESAKPMFKEEAHLRRMRLDKKFAKVKLLLKTNQVTGLDKPPPSFKPPPPTPQAKISDKTRLQRGTNPAAVMANTLPTAAATKAPSIKQRPRAGSAKDVESYLKTVDPRGASPARERKTVGKSPNGLRSTVDTCAKCEQDNSVVIPNHVDGELKNPSAAGDRQLGKTPDNRNLLPTDVLCKNCINKGWTFRTADFGPHSPSSLRRLPLGLSYSMEDDLGPGIKEISSSPPRIMEGQSDSVLSSPKSSPVTHMSTFSHSASSLGDGSSQSDLDFSVDSGKVPLTTIKSLTLPTDMKLGPSPFYSAMEGEHINGTNTKLGVSGLEAVRSSSAPPPPQDIGHWKKDKTGFSRKEKQSKNDADSSRQTEEEEVSSEEKPKKRSVWKSILRRK